MFRRRLLPFFALALAITGCAAGAESTAADTSPKITVANAYARATDKMSVMNGMLMSGVFMEITNNTGGDVSLVGGSSSAAMKLEVHEVVAGVMRKKAGGLLIADGQTQTLKPGGNHVMLMGLTKQLAAGDELPLTLEFSDGTKLDLSVPVKVVNLDQEHYDSSSPTPANS